MKNNRHVVQCPECGKDVLDHMTKCPYCNAELKSAYYNTDKIDSPGRMKFKLLFLIITIAVIMIAAFIKNKG